MGIQFDGDPRPQAARVRPERLTAAQAVVTSWCTTMAGVPRGTDAHSGPAGLLVPELRRLPEGRRVLGSCLRVGTLTAIQRSCGCGEEVAGQTRCPGRSCHDRRTQSASAGRRSAAHEMAQAIDSWRCSCVVPARRRTHTRAQYEPERGAKPDERAYRDRSGRSTFPCSTWNARWMAGTVRQRDPLGIVVEIEGRFD